MTTNHSKEGRPRNGTTFFDTDRAILAEADATQWNSAPPSKWAADLDRRAHRCLHDREYRDMQPRYVRDRADVIHDWTVDMKQNEGPAPNWHRPNVESGYQLPCASLYTNTSPNVDISSPERQYGRSHSAIVRRRIASTVGSCSLARCIRRSAYRLRLVAIPSSRSPRSRSRCAGRRSSAIAGPAGGPGNRTPNTSSNETAAGTWTAGDPSKTVMATVYTTERLTETR